MSLRTYRIVIVSLSAFGIVMGLAAIVMDLHR